MKASKLVLRLAVFAAVSSSLGAFATPYDDQVPFRGHVSGSVTFVGFSVPPSPPFPALPGLPRIEGDSSGNFLHMGRVSASFTYWFLPTGPTSGITFALGTVVGANGDTVYIAGVGSSVATATGRHNDGWYTVIGGTGRFAGATGGGTYTGDQVGVLAAPGDTRAVTLDFDGTISRPNGG